MSQTALNYERIELSGRDGETLVVDGHLAGSATSARETHNHDLRRDKFAPRGVRCSACRWFSVDLYLTRSGGYVVHTVGDTIVPGERRLSRVTETDSPFAVVEALTVRRPDQEPYLTPQALRALAEAADLDDGLAEAYVNRAVA